jgi:DNA-binding PadR family transcriptional regulator
MSIRYAILGLLAEQPMHGYRLKEVFDRRVSPLWGLTTGQIYQSLAVLERAALVESRGERKGRRPTRRVYSITEAGKRDLGEWLQAPTTFARPFREEMVIRLMMLGGSQADGLLRMLARQTDEAKELLAHVMRMRAQRRVEGDGLDLTGVFLESMTHHLEADIKNLELFRGEIVRHRDGEPTADSTATATPDTSGTN